MEWRRVNRSKFRPCARPRLDGHNCACALFPMSDPRKTSRDLFQTSSFPSPLATPPAATLVAPRSSPDGCHELWKKEEKRGTEREKLATGGSHLRREERGGAGGRVAIVPCDSSENRFEIDLFLSSERHFRMHDRDRVVIPWKKIKIFFPYTLRNVARVSPYIYIHTHITTPMKKFQS